MFFLLFIFDVFQSIEAKQVACETIGKYAWNNNIGTLKTCLMKKDTSIQEFNISISNFDAAVKGFTISSNLNILYLPIQVAEKFPNLLAYGANHCSVKEISGANFKGLNKLITLGLNGNQIEMIANDTFTDLVSLETLSISNKN